MTAPTLRFKEFDEGWSTSKIEEIAIVTSGGTPSRANERYWAGDIPWVTTSLVDFNVIQSAEEFITQEGLDNSSAKLFPQNTILMAMYGQGITRGKVAILGIDATTNQACAAIKLKTNFDTQFIFQNLMNRYEEIRDLSNEGGQKNLSAGIIKEVEVNYPEKKEQAKIASFLSAVDEKISQLNQKHRLLCEYKQGMMQKLFSQQLRFKADDGGEFAEWGKIQLKDVAERVTRKNKEDNQNALTISAQMGLVNQQDYFSKQIASRDLSKYYLLHKGEFAYNKSYSAGYPMGAIKRLKLYEKGVVSTLYICFALNDQLNAEFFEHYVESGALVSELEKIAQEGARNHGLLNISLQEFFEVSFVKPCLEEQIKIANFLSAIDQKIEVVAQQIEQAKTWKKGLLQQMFV